MFLPGHMILDDPTDWNVFWDRLREHRLSKPTTFWGALAVSQPLRCVKVGPKVRWTVPGVVPPNNNDGIQRWQMRTGMKHAEV